MRRDDRVASVIARVGEIAERFGGEANGKDAPTGKQVQYFVIGSHKAAWITQIPADHSTVFDGQLIEYSLPPNAVQIWEDEKLVLTVLFGEGTRVVIVYKRGRWEKFWTNLNPAKFALLKSTIGNNV